MQGTAQDHWQGQYSEVVSRVSAYVKNVDTQKGLAYCVARLKEVSALEELEHIKLSDRKFEYPAFFTNVDQYLGIYEASHFLPRQKLMDLLLDKVRTNRICTVVGIAGSGKTQLVLRFSKNLRHTYSAVLWFDASQPQNLRESYRQISDRLDLMPLGARRPLKPPVLQSLFEDDCLMAVNSWLYQRVGRRYLLVFDNCDADLSNHLRKCFPEGENGDIIVTSRDAEVLNSVADGLHGPLVEGLTTDEAIELLLHTENPTLTNEERVHAHEIVCMLDCHPLSVDLASEYMRRLRKTYLNGLTMAT
ncbi:hypothetical protein BJ508DRAFT_170546 [Ascobolus immersus RN42]|uniref:NB-ARC domain-containing protein n=1 Tax=Ascobolus immersus RN42 TaxID=1160509 RepID=A0A3N4HUJ2_ASCIM|nr:hypothetical protein BJ508DRAFT_170546 [Ascobolus immersus RN42]